MPKGYLLAALALAASARARLQAMPPAPLSHHGEPNPGYFRGLVGADLTHPWLKPASAIGLSGTPSVGGIAPSAAPGPGRGRFFPRSPRRSVPISPPGRPPASARAPPPRPAPAPTRQAKASVATPLDASSVECFAAKGGEGEGGPRVFCQVSRGR